MKKKYTVVENAGYERECDVHIADSYGAAIKWRDEYIPLEIHVKVSVFLTLPR